MLKNVTVLMVAAIAASACLPRSPSSPASKNAAPTDSIDACSSNFDACGGRCKEGDEAACRAEAIVFAERHPKVMRWLSDVGINYEDINPRRMSEAARRMCSEGLDRGCWAEKSLSRSGVEPATKESSPTPTAGCKPPTRAVGPFCLLMTEGDRSPHAFNFVLSRPDGTEVWSGEGTDITEATEDHFEVVTNFGGQGTWALLSATTWTRTGDRFEPGPERDLRAEEEAREAEREAKKIESAWSHVERIGDDLAVKKFLHAFAVQHTSGAQNARAAQRMVEHMAMITKEEFCPAVKAFIAKSSRVEFAKRAKLHCNDSPPRAGGLQGEQVECRTECRAVFATACP